MVRGSELVGKKAGGHQACAREGARGFSKKSSFYLRVTCNALNAKTAKTIRKTSFIDPVHISFLTTFGIIYLHI